MLLIILSNLLKKLEKMQDAFSNQVDYSK